MEIYHGWLLDKYFIISKGNFKQNRTLTLNRPDFSESGKARGDSAPLCNFPIWRPMTMKFGGVIPCQKLLPENNKTLDDVILYFRLCLGRRK